MKRVRERNNQNNPPDPQEPTGSDREPEIEEMMCKSCELKDEQKRLWAETKKSFVAKANRFMTYFIVVITTAVVVGYLVSAGNDEQPNVQAVCTEVYEDESTSDEGITIGYIQQIAVEC